VIARVSRTMVGLAWGLCALCAPGLARAQQSSDAPTDGPTVERVEVEDVLHPRPNRARLELVSESGASTALGLASPADQPTVAERGVRFGRVERTPVLCRAPCSMFLRPGVVRLVGDADTPYVWSADVTLSAAGERYVLRSHRVGLSALGGGMFVLGCALGVLGPGVVIVNLWVGDASVRTASIVGGTLAGVAGAGLITGGWFVVQSAVPSVRLAVGSRVTASVGLSGATLSGVF
jgi:hypothetical protein